MTGNQRHLVMAALLFALGACGEPEEEQEGEPLAQLTVELGGELDPSVESPHVGIVWIPYDEEEEEAPLILTESAPLSASLEQIQFSLFQGPPPAAILRRNGGQTAIGLLVAFDDRDGDGTFSVGSEGIEAPDLFFGVNLRELAVFLQIPSDAELNPEHFVNPEAFEPGISRARIDPCTGMLELLPMAAPIVIETFEPSTSFAFLYEETDC